MRIETLKSGNVFQVQKVDEKTGKVSDVEKYEGEQALNDKQTAIAIAQAVKNTPNMRRAWLSFLALVWDNPKLAGYRGTGDVKSGKLSKEMKASVRTAEETCVQAMVTAGMLKLPRAASEEAALQQFLSTIRDDKNYSNAKNLVNRYMAFVGGPLVDGDVLTPAPYMQARIKEILDANAEPETDALPPVSALLMKASEKLGEIEIGADDVATALSILKPMLATLEGIQRSMAEKATEVRGNVALNVAAAAKEAVETAQEQPAAETV